MTYEEILKLSDKFDWAKRWIKEYDILKEAGRGSKLCTKAAFAAVKTFYINDNNEWVKRIFEADVSYNELYEMGWAVIRKTIVDGDEFRYIVDICSTFIVVSANGRNWKCDYTIKDGLMVLDGEWTVCRSQWEDLGVKEASDCLIDGCVLLSEAAKKESTGSVWEVVLISPGKSKNGRVYPESVLKNSISLFEGRPALSRSDSDHIRDEGLNVSNIVGHYKNIKYVEGRGLVGDLHLVENGNWLKKLMLECWEAGVIGGGKELFAYSISACGRVRVVNGEHVVESIDDVISIDVIMRPGTVTGTISLKEAYNGGKKMTPEEILAAEKLREALITVEKMKEDLLVSKLLSESNLSLAGKNSVTKALNGKVITEAIVRESIVDAVTLLASVLPKPVAEGSGIVVGQDFTDKFKLAMDGFFEGQNVGGVPKLVSFKEGYRLYTKDTMVDDFHENFSMNGRIVDKALSNPSQPNLHESLDTASWSYVLGDSIRRKMIKDYNNPSYAFWREIVSDISSPVDFRSNKRLRIGGYELLPVVAPGAPYQKLVSPTDQQVDWTIDKKGGTEDLTWEMLKNDDMGAIKKIPKKLAQAAIITLYRAIFNPIKLNSELAFNDDVTALFTGGHGNLGSTALSATTLQAAKVAMGKLAAFGHDTNILGIVPKHLLVPVELEEIAYKLVGSKTMIGATNNAATEPNINGSYGLKYHVMPDWTDPSDWVVICDPSLCPTIEVGFLDGKEEPELFVQNMLNVGSMFDCDKVTYKIRLVFGVCVLEYRGMYKAIVA